MQLILNHKENLNKIIFLLLNNMFVIQIRDKSTVDYIFALRQIITKHYEFDKKLHLICIDYKQAYDSIDSEKL